MKFANAIRLYVYTEEGAESDLLLVDKNDAATGPFDNVFTRNPNDAYCS